MFGGSVLDTLRSLTGELEGYACGLDLSLLTAGECVEATELFSKAERIAAGAKSLCAARAASFKVHEQEGHRSAEQWLASLSGEGVGRSRSAIEAGSVLGEDPVLGRALRSGELSATESSLIADALRVNPGAGEKLLEAARKEPVRRLMEHCEREKRAARSEEQERERLARLHECRFVRLGLNRDGAVTISGELSPADGAVVKAALEAETRRVFEEARHAGRRECRDAYMADALTALCERGRSVTGETHKAPEHLVVLEVNAESLRRGEVNESERCEIPGVGPVPLATAEELIGRSRLKLVVREGKNVVNVTHLGRSIPAHLHSALVSRDPVCVVPGCGSSYRLEIDHGICWARNGPTELWNLHRLCSFHHRLKTYAGYSLEGGPGSWVWLSPAEREERDNPPPPSGPPDYDAVLDDGLGHMLDRDAAEDLRNEGRPGENDLADQRGDGFRRSARSPHSAPQGGATGERRERTLARRAGGLVVVTRVGARVRNSHREGVKRVPGMPPEDIAAAGSRVPFARELLRRGGREPSAGDGKRRVDGEGTPSLHDDLHLVGDDRSRLRLLQPRPRGDGRWCGRAAQTLERQGFSRRPRSLESRGPPRSGRLVMPHAELPRRCGEGAHRGDLLRGSGIW